MTLQALKRGPWWPERYNTDAATPILGLTLNAASEIGGMVFKAPKTGNIDRVIYSLGSVAVTSGPLNFDARLETMGSTGLNSGSLFGTNTNVTDSIADTDDNTVREKTLTAVAAVTKGEDLCFVLAAPGSGTFSVDLVTIGGDLVNKYPYMFNDTTKLNRILVFGLRYDDGTYITIAGGWGIKNIGASNINSGTTPDEVGNRFQYPVPCKVDAIALHMDPNSSSSFDVRIYDASNNILLDQTFDSDNHSDYLDGSMVFDLDDEIEFAANTTYRVTCRPAASNHEFYYFDVETAAHMDMMDGGQAIHATTRTDDGSWTDTTTRRYMISLRLSALDDGAGGGGGSTTVLLKRG